MKRAAILVVAFALASSLVVGTAQALSLLELEEAVSTLQQFDPELEPFSNDPSKDFVVGGFQAFSFNNGISVRSGPAGEDVTGMASATDPQTGFKIREEAVCLAVQGNLAAVGFRGRFTFPGGAIDDYEEIDVFRDGGPGGTLDGFNAFLPHQVVGATGADDCALALALAVAAPPLERGNILINDAP